METKSLKDDIPSLKDEVNQINLDISDFDENKAKSIDQMHFAVSQIMEGDDLNALQQYFAFLSSFLSQEDIVFPPEFVIKIISFINEDQDPNLLQIVFDLLRVITSFDSVMQSFLVENGIIQILTPFFPDQEIIDIFTNLSCSQFMARKSLYDSDIINAILLHLHDLRYTESLLRLSQNLVYPIDEFDYEEYSSQIIELFHAIIELFNPNEPMSELIIFAFRDYIEASPLFMDDFLKNDYLLLFKNKNIEDTLYFRHFIRICDIILTNKNEIGADYLITNDIPSFIIALFFQVGEEIRARCFHFFNLIMDYKPEISVQLLESDFLTISINEFSQQPKLYYQKFIYQFWCELVLYTPLELLNELASNIAYLIIDNVSLLDDNDHELNLLLSQAILKIDSSPNLTDFQNIIDYMNENEEFYDFLQDTLENIDQLDMINTECFQMEVE